MEGNIGEIRGFGGNFAPRAWAFCQGQLIAISQNTALFSILGTTYGGDGRTSFALPDLRGRVPISSGTGPGLSTHKLGARSGTETVTLNVLQIPSHFHPAIVTDPQYHTTVGVTSEDPGDTDPSDNVLASSAPNNIYAAATEVTDEALGAVTTTQITAGSVQIAPTGGSQYHNNMQPYLTINWIICMFGVFPSRS